MMARYIALALLTLLIIWVNQGVDTRMFKGCLHMTKPPNTWLNTCMRETISIAQNITEPHACWCSCTSVPKAHMNGFNGREHVSCPDQTLERHRFTCFLLMTKRARSFTKILYIAPHHGSLVFVRQAYPNADVIAGFKFIEGSFVPRDAKILDIDVTHLQFPDMSFDLIICEHVLEHVPADWRALQEFYRVLAPGGVALLQVPLNSPTDATIENIPGVKNDADRRRVYGQKDHVRRYGRDFFERVRHVGFAVEEISFDRFYATQLPRTKITVDRTNETAAWAVKR